jgi:hypothetical protein
MSTTNKKKFVGYTKTHTFNSGDTILKVRLNNDDFKLLESSRDSNGFVNLIVNGLGTDKPYIYVDEWKPSARNESTAPASADADLPF